MAHHVSVTLGDLIGDTSHIRCDSLSRVVCEDFNTRTTIPSRPTVIAVHGGPAMTHNYILPLQLLVNDGYVVIFYDQCGCGESSFVINPKVTAPWLLTINYYDEELETLIHHFQLTEYYLYGSSWGTVICQEHAVLQPKGLLGLILDGALSDSKLYIESQWKSRISTLPTYTQALLHKLTDAKQFHSPQYKDIEGRLSTMFTSRLAPHPDFFLRCMELMNPEIYVLMQGESEFTLNGVLKDWSITDRLHQINVPAIVLTGEYDTMTIECSQHTVDHIPYAWPLVVIPRAAHCKLCDEPQACCLQIARFLKTCDAIRQRAVESLSISRESGI